MFAALNEKETRILYIVLLSCAGAGLAVLAAVKLFFSSVADFLFTLIPPCVFRETLGIYCPGCGGVRSVVFLLQGDIVHSLQYHPFTFYVCAAVAVFLVHYTLYLLFRGKVRRPVVHTVWFYLAAAILVVQWIVKLVLLLGFGVAVVPF
ncbi:MAG TPA: DUF2752 domain-containing protein [Methanocorpusculum sp.]|nr:DUF2752 domain-containing protein [Methanocorpusculum sp.]